MERSLQDAARRAAALGAPVRIAILSALLEREATVSDLASRLRLEQPRVSTHLARLRAAGLVARAPLGRHRTYRAEAARVKRLLHALDVIAAPTHRTASAGAERERRRDTPLRHARTCYDHLAGIEGVRLLREMRNRSWLTDTEHGGGYELTPAGMRALAARGVDLHRARVSRRRFTTACLDWTEREPHLGGALGAAILDALIARGHVRRRRGRRDVRIVKPLAPWLVRADR